MGRGHRGFLTIKGVRLPVILLQVGQWLSLGLSGKGRHPRRTRSHVPFQRGLSLGPRRPCGRFMRREAPAKPATCGPHQRERASGDCMCTRGKSDHTHPGPPGGRPLLTQTPEDFPSASFREGWEEGFSLWDGQSRCSPTWATGRSSTARLRVPPQVAAGGTRARQAGLAFLVLVISPTTCRGSHPHFTGQTHSRKLRHLEVEVFLVREMRKWEE